ncbi:hypothetical protein LZ318_40835 [Saccharopolyspora indica]|uniref:hypothetical protein n=1 Tax=Saccharopolyspora indica TaxID=1229659 RepID=UPI0022EA7665|nr:hypothetical protein [Saccharopolyspora indica]MDA3646862.1 hypothetical protein [Saccharopolyspora indica]
MQENVRRRAGRGLALATAIGATLTMATTGAAQAAVPDVLALCSEGSFGSWAEFPERGGLTTVIVPSGQCLEFDLRGDKPEKVEFYADDYELIGTTTYDPSAGLNIATIDTPDGPGIKPF